MKLLFLFLLLSNSAEAQKLPSKDSIRNNQKVFKFPKDTLRTNQQDSLIKDAIRETIDYMLKKKLIV